MWNWLSCAHECGEAIWEAFFPSELQDSLEMAFAAVEHVCNSGFVAVRYAQSCATSAKWLHAPLLLFHGVDHMTLWLVAVQLRTLIVFCQAGADGARTQLGASVARPLQRPRACPSSRRRTWLW